MKASTKQKSILSAMIFALSLVLSAIIAISVLTYPKRAHADAVAETDTGYYYSELRASKLAQRIYHVFTDMEKQGYFLDCRREYDLSNVLTQAELRDYAENKSPTLAVALGAARDAYYLDHPELFYADIYKLRFTIGYKNDSFVAYLGAGAADNYYEDYTATTAEQVTTAKADFESELNKAVTAARANNADVVQQIKNANEYLCNKADYDYCAYTDAHNNVAYNGYVYTAYGVLNGGEGKALCEGYSKAFKAVMDKLGIPCVLIAGAACNGIDGKDDEGNVLEAGYERHMWNAVKVDGQWYGVDVTWNDTEDNYGKYVLLGELALMKNRYSDPVISSSGFEVKYPVLRVLDYGEFTDSEGFEFKDSGTVDGQEFSEDTAMVGVSFEDKNFKQLKASGKYLAMRIGDEEPWIDYSAFNNYMVTEYGYNEFVAGKYTTFLSNMTEDYTQFAIIDVAPDCAVEYFGTSIPNGGWTNLAPEHIVAVSAKYNNQYASEVTGKPFIKSMTPNEKGYIMSYEPVEISITYDEKLIYESTVSTEVGIEVTAERSDIKPTVENVVWHEDTNTVTFTFTPSSPYAHNSLTYNFVPTNLIGEKTGERPEAGRLAFKRDEVICPKVFNDGRLYLKIYGTPQFVSAKDESITDFKDKNGKPIVGDQRSQLMLVINKPTKADAAQMTEAAKELGDTVIESSTFEIDFQMCGLIRKVPTGSFMQIGFGFPEGLSPEDEGLTFTVYHYTRNDDGTIASVDPVPCVVTQYGIIATVKSFSPFMVCAITPDSPTAKNAGKAVLASVDGVGGKVDKTEVITVKDGEPVEYTITKEQGYSIDRVLVNGVDKKASVTADGKLTLSAAELSANNTVVVSFVSDRAADFLNNNNITEIRHELIVTDEQMIKAAESEFYGSATPATPGKKPNGKSNLGLILGIVIPLIIVLAAAGVLVFFLLRKKKATATAGATKKSASSKSAATAKPQATPNKTAQAPAKPTQAPPSRTAQSSARPAQTPTRNAQAPTRNTQTSARPTQNQARPAQRPTQSSQARPAQPTRPTSSQARPQSRPTTGTVKKPDPRNKK